MKKFLLLMSWAPLTLSAFAQTTFSPLSTPGLDSTWFTSATFFDADQDGDQDLIYNGSTLSGATAKLLINNGNGQFTTSSQQFPALSAGKVLSGDFDRDGDLDIFIAGADDNGRASSSLYDNNGAAVFALDSNASFLPFFAGDAEAFDSDGDADLDIIMSGFDLATMTANTFLYLNDGAGNFVPAAADFDNLGFVYAAITVGDVDADGDKDVFVCGDALIDSNYQGVTSRLFLNQGGNNFSASTQNFAPLYGVAEFSDYDKDNDLDLILLGTDGFIRNSLIYDNNGSGQFSSNANNPIPSNLYNPSIKLFDADLDGDQDLFLCGADSSSNMNLFVYYDNQNGTFVPMSGQPFTGIWTGAIEAGDIDGDTDLDLFVSGIRSPYTDPNAVPFASLYVNGRNPLGMQQLTMENFHGIFPNPIAQNQLSFSVAGLPLKQTYDLEVKDVLGRTVFQQTNVRNTQGNLSIELAGMQPGAYFLVLKSGTRQYCDKFLIIQN
jgi:Secretion system C-terminal sorting domain/FG-GAP-like repeat